MCAEYGHLSFSEIPYISFLFADLSDLSWIGSESTCNSENDDVSEVTVYLKPYPLQQRSVIAINSAAHGNNLFVSANKIFVNVESPNVNNILLREYRGYCFRDLCKHIKFKKVTKYLTILVNI